MKEMLRYMEHYKKESILAPVFKLLEALMDLLVPVVVAVIINKGVLQNNRTVIIHAFLILLLLAIAGMLFSFTAQWFAAKASTGYATELRQDLYDHIQKFSYKDLDKLGEDTLITRLTSDVNQVQTGWNLALRLLLRSPFIVFGSMVMAFTINVKAALNFVAVIPLLSIVIFGIMLASIPMYKKVQQGLDGLTLTTRENLTGVRVIRAFCREEDETKEFDEKNEYLTKLNEKVGRLNALMNPLTYALINIATIVLIYTGALQVNAGSMATGDVVALYNYMAQIIVELIKLASLIITINRSLACGERIQNILNVEPSMEYPDKDSAVSDSDESLSFDHVSLSYEGSDDAIEDINFTVKKGETIGIIGGTGSGKSSLVNLIPRFYDPQKGVVKVDGVDVKDYAEGSLIHKIGMVPQKAVLFEGTIRDNLKWGNEDADDEQLWKALQTAQAEDVVQGKGGLDAEIEQNGRNLSGGQKQRLTIARALVRKPEILIMDDSSSALDFATDLRLRKAVHNLEGNMTVFIVSQRTSSVRDADMILVMDNGRIVGKGKHAELLKNCSVYQEIYYSQFPDEKKEAGYEG